VTQPPVGGSAEPPGAPETVTVTVANRAPTGDRAWLLAFLPGFPLLLLVLRVWFLAQQDLPTMLLVLQSASPLGLIASLLISLLWAIPAMILLLRVFYLLLLVSAATGETWLTRLGRRMPLWVSVPAVLLAGLTWQLRFLPTLLMFALVIAGLEVRLRFSERFWSAAIGIALPIAVGLSALAWLLPAIHQALTPAHEPVTVLLLVGPLLAAPLVGGPIPPGVARWLLPSVATVLALTTPILLGDHYLKAAVLPRVAVQYTDPAGTTAIQRGSLVSVDDTFTAILDAGGRMHFVPDTKITAQVLCSTGPPPPTSSVYVHGWPVEQSALAWAAPRSPQTSPDARCRGD
jgi:hypothetical protein